MKQELTPEQINGLFAFCRKHYVQFYDVQVELVDHLANAIEEKMDLNKKMSFETALASVYSGFGIKGFSEIVKTRTYVVNKRCRKLRQKLFFSYFTWPKAAMTLCCFLTLAILPQLLPGNVLPYLIIILFIALYVFELRVIKQVKNLFKTQKQPLLLTGSAHDQPFITAFGGIQLLIPFYNHTEFFEKAPYTYFWGYLACCAIMVLLLVTSLAYKEFANNLKELACKEYPEVFAVTA
jgi:hypothetical protein